MKLRNLAAALTAVGMILCMAGCSDGGPKGNVTNNLIKSPVSGTSPKGEKLAPSVVAVELADGDKIAEIEIEGYGTIKAKLYPDIAPIGVKNFIDLAEEGYYDGLKIHRVVADFMMQGGSLNGDGTGGNAKTESSYFEVEADKSARHFYGALCYANAMGRNTTQFYIVNNHISQDISELNAENINTVVTQLEELLAQCEADTTEYMYYNSQAKYYKNLADFVTNATEDVKKAYMEVGGTPVLDGGYTVFGQVYEGYDIIDKISRVEVGTNSSGEESKPLEDIIIKTVNIVEYKTPTEDENTSSNNTPTSSDSSSNTESKVQTVEAAEQN
ncbi:MAG: peptidylprolyl isomerase [Oscillospiraceae bacterium]